MTQYSWSLWDSLKAAHTSQYDPPSVTSTATVTAVMTEKEMLVRLNRIAGELEASLHHVQETSNRRLSKLEGETAADVAEVRASLQEMAEGVVRHRDNIMREFHDLVADVRAVSGRMDRLEGSPRAERQDNVLLSAEVVQQTMLADELLRYNFALNGGAGPISSKGIAIFRAVERIVRGL